MCAVSKNPRFLQNVGEGAWACYTCQLAGRLKGEEPCQHLAEALVPSPSKLAAVRNLSSGPKVVVIMYPWAGTSDCPTLKERNVWLLTLSQQCTQ